MGIERKICFSEPSACLDKWNEKFWVIDLDFMKDNVSVTIAQRRKQMKVPWGYLAVEKVKINDIM